MGADPSLGGAALAAGPGWRFTYPTLLIKFISLLGGRRSALVPTRQLGTKALGWLVLSVLLLALLGTAAARTTAARRAAAASAVYTVKATAYEAVAGQTDSKPFITADNSRIPRGYGSHTRWLALSRDLLRPWGGPFEFGDKVQVRGISPALDGVYTVHDTMNRRYRHCLDVLVHPREHVTISRSGVKIRRVAPSRRQSNAGIRLAYLRTSRPQATAHRRSRPHHVLAQRPAPRRRATSVAVDPRLAKRLPKQLLRTKRGRVLARQKPSAAKKQLATLHKHPKKRVAARVAHRATA
jgi:3D (Asp-Asp-Asp) domain-containing protein